ncbi:MAG: hypothetical protein JST22_11770 [Bacteroidetes bacterium]|nr:hypothetical protein [Bacteroidota bacterium]
MSEDGGGRVRVYWASHASDGAGMNDRIISYSILVEDQAVGVEMPGVQGRWTIADTVAADGSGLYPHVVPTPATGSAAACADFEGAPFAFYRIVAIDSLGNNGPGSAPSGAVASAATPDVPLEFLIAGANYPQPCSVSTTIPLTLGRDAMVSVAVRDQLGTIAASLDEQWMPAGENRIQLSTTGLPSGTDHCVVRAGETGRSIMLRVVR